MAHAATAEELFNALKLMPTIERQKFFVLLDKHISWR